MRKLANLLALAIISNVPLALYAQVRPVYSSVEVYADSADLIVVARVKQVDTKDGTASDPARPMVTFTVEETIKGRRGENLSLPLDSAFASHFNYDFPGQKNFREWQDSNTRLLMFVSRVPYPATEKHRQPRKYVNIVALTPGHILEVSARLTELTTAAQVIEAARSEVARTHGAIADKNTALSPPYAVSNRFSNGDIIIPWNYTDSNARD